MSKITSPFHQLSRWAQHAWLDQRSVNSLLPTAARERLAHQVHLSESRHRGELRICVEASLSPSGLWRGTTARARAIELFSQLGVWDTEHNNGVLIYLLVADQRIEILADRGLTRRVPEATWQAAVAHLGQQLQAGRFEQGLQEAIEQVGQLLQAHYPLPQSNAPKPNELPDAVVVI